MEPPEDFRGRFSAQKPERREVMVLQLHKSLNGLKQAPRVWIKAFHAFLTSLGFKRSEADYSFCIQKDAIIIIDADDPQIPAKSAEVIRNIKQNLMAKYQMTDRLGRNKTLPRC